MELLAVLVQTTKIESGKSNNGTPFNRCTAIFQTVENNPRQVAVTCLNRQCDEIQNFKPGDLMKVQLNADSHEFQGKWFTELRAWSMKRAFNYAPPAPTQAAPAPTAPAPAAPAPAAPAPTDTQFQTMLDENGNQVRVQIPPQNP